jgi:hypothetical protein
MVASYSLPPIFYYFLKQVRLWLKNQFTIYLCFYFYKEWPFWMNGCIVSLCKVVLVCLVLWFGPLWRPRCLWSFVVVSAWELCFFFFKLTFSNLRVSCAPYEMTKLSFRGLSHGCRKMSNFAPHIRALSHGFVGGQLLLFQSKACHVANFNWPHERPNLL